MELCHGAFIGDSFVLREQDFCLEGCCVSVCLSVRMDYVWSVEQADSSDHWAIMTQHTNTVIEKTLDLSEWGLPGFFLSFFFPL